MFSSTNYDIRRPKNLNRPLVRKLIQLPKQRSVRLVTHQYGSGFQRVYGLSPPYTVKSPNGPRFRVLPNLCDSLEVIVIPVEVYTTFKKPLRGFGIFAFGRFIASTK
ncbi:hypothetical protein RF11_07709 [Thelohanellus kitauei]|uniref:Uncharacterized protein n=1 Tax=Thelohanellus kitauei TaxID=669202 RepID=A0A0C2MJF9_THEKT|nr:hypothetical protein RF11_07709 [Thelohanellus kitauei]